MAMRPPMALPPGQKRRARVWLTTITAGDCAVSESARARPATRGIPMAPKYAGVTERKSASGRWPGPGAGRPSTAKSEPMPRPVSGRAFTAPTARTPGRVAMRSDICRKKAIRRSVAAFRPPASGTRTVSTCAG